MNRYWLAATATMFMMLIWVLWSEPELEPEALDGVSERLVNKLQSRNCEFQSLNDQQIDCYFYEVESEQINFTLPVAVLRAASDTPKHDPLVLLPGGPGGGYNTGAGSLRYWEQWLLENELERDLVLFDWRGTAPGQPSWDCPAYSEKSKELLTQNLSFAEEAEQIAPVVSECLAEFDRALQQGEGLRSPLTENSGAGLAAYNTRANADDVAELLRALGYVEWNLLGVSYGSRVAMVVADTQPEVRRLILDSPYPPGFGDLAGSTRLWVEAFATYFKACDEGKVCPPQAVDSQTLFWRVMERLKAEPITVVSEKYWQQGAQPWVLNDGRFASVLYYSLYRSDLRHQILAALQGLVEGDSSTAQPLLDSFYNSAFDPTFNAMVFLATECNDNRLISNEEYATVLEKAGPWADYLESEWQFNACRQANFSSGQLVLGQIEQPVLVASGAYDPVTPVSYAHALADRLHLGVTLKLKDAGHTEFYGGHCGQHWISWFLDAPEEELLRLSKDIQVICH